MKAEEEYRVCTNCGKRMTSGYVIADGLEYFCDDECLAGWYSKEEYLELYEDGEAYWTDWWEDDGEEQIEDS